MSKNNMSAQGGSALGGKKYNCWEIKKCGREEGGKNVDEHGVCPAFLENKLNNVNSGKNAGRACWVVAGTYCKAKVKGLHAAEINSCVDCEFYKMVVKEEGQNFKTIIEVIKKLNKRREND